MAANSLTLYELGHQYSELIAALGETDQTDADTFEAIGTALERIQEGLEHKATAADAMIRSVLR